MSRRRRPPLQYHVGPMGKCPECGKKTIFRRGSFVSEKRYNEDWTIERSLLKDFVDGLENARALAIDRWGEDRPFILCPACRAVTKELIWVTLPDGKIAGPHCRDCTGRVVSHLDSEDGTYRTDKIFVARVSATRLEGDYAELGRDDASGEEQEEKDEVGLDDGILF